MDNSQKKRFRLLRGTKEDALYSPENEVNNGIQNQELPFIVGGMSEDPQHAASSDDTGSTRKRLLRAHERLVLVLCIILALGAFVVVFLMNFSVNILSEEGKITLSISRRGMDDVDPNALDQTQENDVLTEEAVSVRAGDDGTRMQITSGADSSQLSFQEIYARLIDSVVCVEASNNTATVSASGIIMSASGYIITNTHVISGAYIVRVILQNGDVFTAALVGSDAATDLAVLKINKNDCAYAEFGDSDDIRVGDTVLAIGNPLGAALAGTLTDGIISALNRDVEVNGYAMTLIQTNAALNAGSSGGPLINMYGQVIGINTIKSASIDESVEGIGFAIPSRTAKSIVDALIAYGCISGRPSLGFDAVDYDLPASVALFYGTPSGVVVSSVDARSDAYDKGIRRGDILVSVNGEDIYTVSELSKVKNHHVVGDKLTIIIYRQGSYYQVNVALMDEADLKD